MRIVLISFVVHPSPFYREEIGLASVASTARRGGHDVLLLSEHEDSLDYERIVRHRPDVLGATVYGPTKELFYRFGARVRSLLPDCRIVVGGYLPTYGAREMMREAPFVDFAVKREGEITFLELVDHLARGAADGSGDGFGGIAGLVHRRGDEVVENEDRPYVEDLDALPFPSRDVLEEHGIPLAQVSTSRGCRANCSFCVARSFWSTWRGRSRDNVLAELSELHGRGIRHFNFTDSSFEDPDKNCERVLGLARAILESGMRVSYVADARAELHRKLDGEQIELLRRSGLRSLFVGIEAANEEDLRLYKKACRVEDVYRSMEVFPRHGIRVRPGFMNFNPYSTPDRLRRNLAFLSRFGLACNYFWLTSRYALESGGRLSAQIEADSLLEPGAWDEPYRYRFADERIEELYRFLVTTFERLDREYGLPSWTQFCEDVVLEILHDLRAGLADDGDRRRSAPVGAVEADYRRLLGELNAANTALATALLDTVEDGWSDAAAERLVERHLDAPGFARRVAELEATAMPRIAAAGIEHPILDAVLTTATPQEVGA